jgi:hypothetical protein
MIYSCLSFRIATLLACLAPIPLTALELHVEKKSPYDLALSGLIEGVPAGETRYVHWDELSALPTRVLKLDGEFVPGPQDVTVVMLSDLLANLPHPSDADTVLATCSDGYASIYTREYIKDFLPFLVLKINDQGPDSWPPAGLKFNPGPYVISIADQLAPGVSKLLDAGHKRPWGVNAIELVNYDQRFAVLHQGALAHPSATLAEGREIWINSCFSCHNIPQSKLGGTKAGRTIQILATYAAYNTEYFKTYVRTPTKLNPAAKMEAHPHYTDEQLDSLTAFLKATLAQ